MLATRLIDLRSVTQPPPMLRAAGFAAVLVASLLDAAVGQLRECDRRALAEPKSFELPTGEYPPPWKLEFEKSSTFQATQDAARGHINYRFDAPFVVTEHRLLFCKVAKVASSGWLRLLRRLSGDEGWRGNPYFIDKEHGWVAGVRQLAHLEHADALATLRDRANWTRIVVVRDPAERLLSAFLDKIHRHDDSSTQLAMYSSELFGLPESEFANETSSSAQDSAIFW